MLTHFVMNDQPALLALYAFQPVAQFNGMIMPSTIRSADFNGDGVIDRTSSGTVTRYFRNDGLGTLTEVLPLNAKAPRTLAPVIDQSAYAHH